MSDARDDSGFARIAAAFRDTRATDICFGAAGLTVDRGEGLRAEPGFRIGEEELRNWVLQQISRAGKSFDAKSPFVDLVVPAEGAGGFRHRLHAIFPPLSPAGVLVSLRKLPEPGSLDRVWEDSPYYPILREIVRNHETILVSGSTGSGKTRLTTELLSEISPHERILALEDTPELAPPHPQFFSLLSRSANADGFGEVTLRTLLRQTLRMRPDRIVLGEIRGNEVLDLLQALNTGHRGTLATLHANSPREALKRIEVLCLLAAGTALPLPALRELLAGGIRWIAQVERAPEGRRVRELVEVAGREGDTILLRPKAPLR
ncbi:MAG: Flp pilus assembly complex ATPase component TadA [Bdellovibrionales bacterium]|nr:Flp pilus assembly complex ATPase component TadA [Bdellovibrionales bacterium]